MADTIQEKITEQALSAIDRVKTDAGEVQATKLSDLIEADRYLRSVNASKNPTGGLRIRKLVPPGAP